MRGGKRPGAGRKSKAEEIKLLEKMDKIKAPEEVWQKIAELIDRGNHHAIRLWLAYRFGLPKQTLDHTSDGETIDVTFKVIGSK